MFGIFEFGAEEDYDDAEDDKLYSVATHWLCPAKRWSWLEIEENYWDIDMYYNVVVPRGKSEWLC